MPGGHSGTSVMCDCHGTERLLDIRPGMGIEVKDDRHGCKHVAMVESREVLQRLAGTLDGSAIMEYVRQVVIS